MEGGLVAAQGATIFYAWGSGVRQKHLGLLGVTLSAEKEVIYIVAASDQADRIFDKISNLTPACC